MQNFINIIKTNRKKVFIICFIIILIIIFLLLNIFKDKKNINKVLERNDYVFTQVNQNQQKLPYINIRGTIVEKINDELYNMFYTISENENNKYDYKYHIDNNILYLFIKIDQYNSNNVLNPKYISYYIDINKGTLYNVEEILKMHNFNLDKLSNIIDEKLNMAYTQEIELGYVEKGFCDFECYKDIHEINPLQKRIALYFNGKDLIAYLNYNVETIYYTQTNPVEFPHVFKL